ncbi:MAG: SAM-dependent methyltransferase [Microbacteriaceae bacterium]|jgi:methylase of polypeptide subunit release factors|nr:SAM-dependent methyltransferase [Microbacteriaceae bacterium]
MALNGEVTEPNLISRLRNDLETARFNVETLSDLWGTDAAAALYRGQRVPAFRALVRTDPVSTLARFFVLNAQVPRDALASALPSLGVDGAVALGLAEDAGAADVRPLFDLRPYRFVDSNGIGAWWILSDLGEVALGHELREDHVLGVGGASLTLSGLMVQTPVGSALDLGTGCGIQALHAARHAGRVVATDISARALRIARLNAELNEVKNIEFRLGSLFDPVKGERFDQIVSNPPFVITPRDVDVPAYEYRDGGMVGDELVASVVRGVAEHLAPGGVAQLLGNWEYRGDGDAFGRVAEWLQGTGLDAWVIEREVQDAALYAETWIRDGGTRPGRQFDALYNAWLDDFAAREVRSVGFGYVTLRRPPGAPTLLRLERMPGPLGHNPTGLGEHLASCLAAHDWQASGDDDDLLRSHLTVAGDVTEERHYWPGAEDPTVMTLHQGAGFGRSVPLDTALAAFVGACDGDLSVAVIIGALAQLLNADDGALRGDLLPRARELLVTGFLHA